MGILFAADPHGEEAETDTDTAAANPIAAPPSNPAAASIVAWVRLLMLISGLTTMIAIAAVVGVIGYRAFRAGESGASLRAHATIDLPKAARVIATVVGDDRIVVTIELAGATEIRTFDIKTLKETGQIRFAPEQ